MPTFEVPILDDAFRRNEGWQEPVTASRYTETSGPDKDAAPGVFYLILLGAAFWAGCGFGVIADQLWLAVN